MLQKTLGLAGAVGLGAALMYLLDPSAGRRRRHQLLDRGTSAGRRAYGGAGRFSRDLRNRVGGWVASARRAFRRNEGDGEELAARIRSRLGRVVSNAHAIDVSVEDGRVVLSGPILAEEALEALRETARVPGVEEVDDRLDVFEVPERVPALQGLRSVAAPSSRERRWRAGVRTLVTASGGVLMSYGLRRRGRIGSALGLAGAALTAGALGRRRARIVAPHPRPVA